MKISILQIDVPLVDVQDGLLNQIADDTQVALDLVKRLDESVAEWDFILALADYFAEQKRIYHATSR